MESEGAGKPLVRGAACIHPMASMALRFAIRWNLLCDS